MCCAGTPFFLLFTDLPLVMDIITIGIPSVIMILSYGIIWWFAWKNGKYLKRIGHDDLKKVISKRENQTTKTLFMVCLCYLLFVAPISFADTQAQYTERTLDKTRKYPLRGYILGVLKHTTAWDRLWEGDETLK